MHPLRGLDSAQRRSESAPPADDLAQYGIRVNEIGVSPAAPAEHVAGVAFALCTADLAHTTGARIPVV